MPSLAPFHPVIVHFAIGLAVAGVLLRWLSLGGRIAWAGPAAATLLLTSAVAVFAAARSGTDAHGPVERVPGSAQAVSQHEEWGNRTYRAFVVVGLLELVALALRARGRAKPVLIASALVGLGGLYALYEAGEHGGELVYSYAGGIGIRTGAPEDVGRLLLAGLYHQAQLDRKAQRPEDAAVLIEMAARRFPSDPLAAAESLLLDRKDAGAAVAGCAHGGPSCWRTPSRARETRPEPSRRSSRSAPSSHRTKGSRSGSTSSAAAARRRSGERRRQALDRHVGVWWLAGRLPREGVEAALEPEQGRGRFAAVVEASDLLPRRAGHP